MDYFVDLSMKASSWFNRIFKPSPFYSKRLPDGKILLRNRTLEEIRKFTFKTFITNMKIQKQKNIQRAVYRKANS